MLHILFLHIIELNILLHYLYYFVNCVDDVCISFFFSKVPAFLNVVDIAGLVKGASEGQGLGNAFLSHIKACDALFHLCSKYHSLVLYLEIHLKLINKHLIKVQFHVKSSDFNPRYYVTRYPTSYGFALDLCVCHINPTVVLVFLFCFFLFPCWCFLLL